MPQLLVKQASICYPDVVFNGGSRNWILYDSYCLHPSLLT
ncbi:hypothetical protein AWB67_05413 [Caballeronia terrestris]|uniref:Uncharacterized protein n=1 Tax=Caballeronia terrestris TaxID=1226301 RepID=A0A158KFQ0_9BURK|nr:hypothetical protein AWB67_05413 [Caballeronia terrestris]